MPDVFKILKDLEYRSVGLDPQTKQMQEGYFISFRSIALPIPMDDFVNPWDPFGGNLDKALEKPIPKTDPADPKTAPKTGSSKLTTDAIYAARIGQDQKNYVNTFFLADSQLRMNNEYAVMPNASRVSDAWWAIITGANGIPTQSNPNPDLQKALDAARAKLVDADGNMTPHYKAYQQFQKQYETARKALLQAFAQAQGDPIKMQNWPNDGVAYQDAVDQAMNNWVGFGFKEEIENAMATLAAQGTDPAIALISRAKQRYTNSLNEFPDIGEIPYTFILPSTWYDPDNDDGWTQYTNEQANTQVDYTASSTSYGGGGGFSIGLWSAAGSFDHMESQSNYNFQTSDLEISFKFCAVDVQRAGFETALLNLKNWFLMGDYKKGSISNGQMGQELVLDDPTFLPSIVTSLVLVKDLTIKWGTMSDDLATHSEMTDASVCVGYGPFIVSGSYSHHGEQSHYTASLQNEGLVSHGIQLVGSVSMITPFSPGHDSSEFLTH